MYHDHVYVDQNLFFKACRPPIWGLEQRLKMPGGSPITDVRSGESHPKTSSDLYQFRITDPTTLGKAYVTAALDTSYLNQKLNDLHSSKNTTSSSLAFDGTKMCSIQVGYHGNVGHM